MGSNGSDNVAISTNDEAKGSEAMVDIKIKTLDSQTYSLRVDKCVSVPALKEQIATVTGILSEQQRLICRGKVLKDDQLLSAYHVEDGHTLHLVVRQPVVPSAENASDDPASDPASGSGHYEGSRVGPSVLVGSFNISEQGDGMPDIGRILSAVLGSIGISSMGSGSEEINLNESVSERAYSIPGLGGLRSVNRQQSGYTASRDQSTSTSSPLPYPTGPHLESLQPQVIPDSLTTLTQFLSHLRQEFGTNVRGQHNSQATEPRAIGSQDSHDASGPVGLPTPAALAGVVMSTRHLLNEQTEECLLQIARQMENQVNVTDPLERTRTQAYALRSGALIQNLGALLLELGRTIMTLRMGQTPADAVVNAGPAIFVSPTCPNPIMVQPLPFQPGTNYGAVPVGNVQHSSGATGGSSFAPRNIDIRIRTAVSRRDPSSQNQGQDVPPTSNDTPSAPPTTTEGAGRSSNVDPEVRVVPIRSLFAALPAPVGRAASNSSHGSLGVFYPVLARVQHVSSGNSNNARSSQAPDQHLAHNIGGTGRSSIPTSAAHTVLPGLDGNNISVSGISNVQDDADQVHGLNQLLRTIFSGEHPHGENVNSQGTGTASENTVGAQVDINSQEPSLSPSEEGLFLSNILHQIMPLVSESIGAASNGFSADGGTAPQGSSQAPTNTAQGSTSHQRPDPSSEPSPKRHKGE